MKRLTKKDDRGYYLTGDGIYSDWSVPEKFRGEDIDRIATIENILGDDYELDRLRELVEAERDGRCVVLPCKPGDTVWRIVNDAIPHITKDQCLAITLDNGNMWIDLIGASMNGAYFGQRLFRTRADAEDALKATDGLRQC